MKFERIILSAFNAARDLCAVVGFITIFILIWSLVWDV